MHLLQQLVEKARKSGTEVINGKDVFQLYDTFGFPLELTTEILAEQGLEVDRAEFEAAMQAQRERARAARGEQGYLDSALEVFHDIAGTVESRFSGYEKTVDQGRIVALLKDNISVDQAQAGDVVAVVLDATPFYAESGGQVADTGWITTEAGKVQVDDVQKPVEGLIVHKGKVVEGIVQVGAQATAAIGKGKRRDTARHHTATHLLHKALKDVLGDHVNQAGSYVGPDRLRFDFTHFEGLDDAVLRRSKTG